MNAQIAHERRVCGAKTRSGGTCKLPPLPNGRCRFHGGKNPVGPAASRWKDGRYSKYLPTGLLTRYQEAARDPELLALRDEVGLIDTRLSQLLEQLDPEAMTQRWSQARMLYLRLTKAIEAEDSETMTASIHDLGKILAAGADEGDVWDSVLALTEQRRKLVETERKRLVDMQQMVTSEQAMGLVSAVVEIVRTHVTDRAILARIAGDVARLADRRAE